MIDNPALELFKIIFPRLGKIIEEAPRDKAIKMALTVNAKLLNSNKPLISMSDAEKDKLQEEMLGIFRYSNLWN